MSQHPRKREAQQATSKANEVSERNNNKAKRSEQPNTKRGERSEQPNTNAKRSEQPNTKRGERSERATLSPQKEGVVVPQDEPGQAVQVPSGPLLRRAKQGLAGKREPAPTWPGGPKRTRKRARARALTLTLLLAACTNTNTNTKDTAATEKKTITLVAYDSFVLPKETLDAFTASTGIRVEVLTNGDTGELVNKAILTKDNPIGDVLWGVDNTWLGAAREADIFEPYRSVHVNNLASELRALAADDLVTPVDFGDVCVNADRAAFSDSLPLPTSFEDLIDPKYKGKLVVQNPATSSPGLAFVLSTIATYGTTGENDWKSYWRKLRDNDVKIVNGWTEAYETWFSAGSGKGAYPLVVSYGSSPPAAVLFGPDPKATQAPTVVVESTCFRQVEFAGILKGTDDLAASQKLIDALAGADIQKELPLNMFVYPANTTVALPDLFVRFAAKPTAPLTVPSSEIAANRARWIDEWTDVML